MMTIEALGEELAKPRPEHAAVEELTRSEQHGNDVYAEVTRWQNVGCFMQALLILAAAGQLMSGFIFTMMAEACFRPFEISGKITDAYEDGGLNGSAFNIMILEFPYAGPFALFLFVVASVFHYIFSKTMSARVRGVLRSEGARV
eukprot:gnl/TRDRNA2_/TRDRNA2_79081_c1_seq1.p1 gnl/TRDRNA2_/TRDRNA2_79081_c1~~gnl/TRDRNA2_/TRDRNA2_79081_c1_seq1.p1  ORF type:complete len:157 (-),score=21.92 gnl/TRDRNA2_/TRDRNA2_79081_c1_seq1:78-512(-)